jgi:hypothetical protein
MISGSKVPGLKSFQDACSGFTVRYVSHSQGMVACESSSLPVGEIVTFCIIDELLMLL